MNRTIALSLVLTAAAAVKTYAGEITMEPYPFVPSLTRAEVQAELQQARAVRLDAGSQEAGPIASFLGERTRADVTAEYLADRDTVSAMTGEDSGSMHRMAHRGSRTPATRVVASHE